ncbi:MAG TPA: alpha/beta hydrolase [Methylomirabilota bacterium]|nr:alpha/beta hydrolase [Methylomirabilota bacterium]
MASFVLVHGSFGGGWCWQKVAPLLEAAGHQMYRPTLTGLADRSHLLSPSVDLKTHISDVAELLFYEDIDRAILVGHSYSGMVITGVAQTMPQRVAQLIYFDAYVPQPGQSRWDLVPPDSAAAEREAVGPDGGTGPPPPASIFVPIESGTAAWIDARLSPRHPVGTYEQSLPPDGSALESISRAFIQCMLGPSRFGPSAAKARDSGWPVRELAAGHFAMLTHPREVAQLLLELAGENNVGRERK